MISSSSPLGGVSIARRTKPRASTYAFSLYRRLSDRTELRAQNAEMNLPVYPAFFRTSKSFIRRFAKESVHQSQITKELTKRLTALSPKQDPVCLPRPAEAKSHCSMSRACRQPTFPVWRGRSFHLRTNSWSCVSTHKGPLASIAYGFTDDEIRTGKNQIQADIPRPLPFVQLEK